MSRDDSYVAIGFGSSVTICDLSDLQNCKGVSWNLGQLRGLESQRLDLSPEKVTTARRALSGRISLESCDLSRLGTWTAITNLRCFPVSVPEDEAPSSREPSPTPLGGADDFGLSSVLYNETSRGTVVTAYTSTRYSVFNSTGFKWKAKNCKLQGAAQGPLGKFVIIADASYRLFRINMQRSLVDNEVSLNYDHLQIRSEDDLMSIAMPDDDTVHTFWIRRGDMILTTISGDWTNASLKKRSVPMTNIVTHEEPD